MIQNSIDEERECFTMLKLWLLFIWLL